MNIKYVRKYFRLSLFLRHSIYYLFRVKAGNWEDAGNLEEVGFVDKKLNVILKDQATKITEKEQDVVPFKDGKIKVYHDGESYLVGKSFKGIRKYNNFYNEIICLKRLSEENLSPAIKYVDHENCKIYMELVEGIPLSKNEGALKDIAFVNKLVDFVERVHDCGIFIHDVRSANFIIQGEKLFIIDLSDAVYLKNNGAIFTKRAFERLVKTDFKKLEKDILPRGAEI